VALNLDYPDGATLLTAANFSVLLSAVVDNAFNRGM